jgi:hypothetical protein
VVTQWGAGSDAVRLRYGSAARNAAPATTGTKAARMVSRTLGCGWNGAANWWAARLTPS